MLASDLSLVHSISCSGVVRGVSVDGAGNVHAAVTDRIEVFTMEAVQIAIYGRGYLAKAVDVAFLKTQCHFNSYSFVSDYSASKLLMFDWMNNTVLVSVSISYPLGIAISQEGSIYMCSCGAKYVFIL